MNLNFNQKLAILVAVLGVVAVASTQITDIIAPFMDPKVAAALTKSITSFCALLGSAIAAVLAIFTNQTNLVRDVKAMPGVENILVNEKATPALAKLAADPAEPKIEPTPQAEQAVVATANNG